MQKEELLAMLWSTKEDIVCISVDKVSNPRELRVSYLNNPFVAYELTSMSEVGEAWDELVAGKILPARYATMLCDPKYILMIDMWKNEETPMLQFQFRNGLQLSFPYRTEEGCVEDYMQILKFLSTEQDVHTTVALSTTKH